MNALTRITVVVAVLVGGAAPAAAQSVNQIILDRIKEAGSAARLTEEGRVLHRSDNDGGSWGQYCAAAWREIEQGRLREGIRNASKALYLGKMTSDAKAMAHATRDLALAYSYAGELQQALQLANQSIQHTRASDPTWNWNAVLMVAHKVRADVLARQAQYAQAIDAYKTALDHSNTNWAFFARVALANAYIAAKDFAAAKALFADIGTPFGAARKSLVLRAQGNLALATHQSQEALRVFQEALRLSSSDDEAYNRVWALEGAARAHLLAGDKAAALKTYLDATRTAEQVRAEFHSEEFKSGLFGEMRTVFDGAIRLLAESGQAAAAWEMSERGRARALVDLLRQRVKPSVGRTILSAALPASPKLAELQAQLTDGQLLLQYHVLPEATYVWTIRKTGIDQARIAIPRQDLAAEVEKYRDQLFLRPEAGSAELGRALYQKLVLPAALKDGEQILIVPHDALHYLPFQALRVADQFLVEQHAISYAPSASVLDTLLKRPLHSVPLGVLAMGNPDLNDPALALPGAQREVELIGQLYPDAAVFVGKSATKDALVSRAATSRLLHIAAHAEVDRIDPLFSRIRFARGQSVKADLEAHEVYRLDLSRAETVVLSACDSGLGRVSNGDELWGFTRAFLGAGTATLVVSLWPVADESTERFMADFHRQRLKGSPRHTALRAAQLSLLKEERFRDPFFWAAFNLIGDWR